MRKDTDRMEEIINWTLPGLTMYYRDSELPENIICKYKIGQIFRSQTFVDVSEIGGKLTKNCRFIFASSKAAPLYQINPKTEKWKLNVINANSYFKVLDVYKKANKTQILLLHIPAKGIDFFKNMVLQLGKDNLEDKFIKTAKKSFNDKMKTEPIKELEEKGWIERTKNPIGLDDTNNFFPLIPPNKLLSIAIPTYEAIFKMTNDTELNVVEILN